MPSYHLLNGVGPAVKCAHDPCKLHGSSDFQAKNQADANVIGEQLVGSMYGNVKTDGLAAYRDDMSSRMAMMNSQVIMDREDKSLIGNIVNGMADDVMGRNLSGGPDATYAKNRTAIDSAITGQITDMKDIPRETAESIVDSYQGSFTGLRAKAQDLYGIEDDAEPTVQQLSAAAVLDKYRERVNDALSDSNALGPDDIRSIRRDAGAVISGKTNLDEVYVAERMERLASLENDLKAGAGDKAGEKAIRDRIARCREDIRRGTMPDEVRRSVIGNAWRNASPYSRRKAIASMDPEVLRYAPPETIARSLRHRKEQQRFEILDSIGRSDPKAMGNVILNGGINRSDAMTWVNRHKVKDADGNINENYRMINSYLRSTFTRQGHARYSESSIRRSITRMRDTDRFRDPETGEYSPHRHAQALYDIAYGSGARGRSGMDVGYLPLASRLIAHKALPKRAVVEFAAMSARREAEGDANESAEAAARRTSRWNAMRFIIPGLYGNVDDEADAMRRSWEANGVK